MPWKDRYTTSDERTLDRVQWPDGAPCALIVTVDLSPACGPDGITPKELEAEDTEYAMHVGVRRLLDAFERHRVAATFATPAIIAETWPERVREITARGHEVAAHGERHEDPGRLARAEEQERIARVTATLANIAGARPHGWYSLPRPGDRYAGGQVSPHTIDSSSTPATSTSATGSPTISRTTGSRTSQPAAPSCPCPITRTSTTSSS